MCDCHLFTSPEIAHRQHFTVPIAAAKSIDNAHHGQRHNSLKFTYWRIPNFRLRQWLNCPCFYVQASIRVKLLLSLSSSKRCGMRVVAIINQRSDNSLALKLIINGVKQRMTIYNIYFMSNIIRMNT